MKKVDFCVTLLVFDLGMEEVGLHFDWVECDGPFLLINQGMMKMYYLAEQKVHLMIQSIIQKSL